VGKVISGIYDFVCVLVCLFVCTLKGKQLELSAPNLVDIHTVLGSHSAGDPKVKGHSHMVIEYAASRACVCLAFLATLCVSYSAVWSFKS